ncbi:hypothetical protein FHT44_004941 [Mycolicibacterium sp. BK634]|uniref:hypothetical protein n=1 Tax=Mycolicibacterium sp. BK634 TaxID=2587099 RepID=UPI001623163D|nr:hypothetical protein [Mycolicibacterium sp. BK634]MBB3752429.1 hypothetical protein [Mycolicibacterium sp. BK634]
MKRVAGAFGVAICLVLALASLVQLIAACVPATPARGELESVRVQRIDGGASYPFLGGCLIFTHDSMQGASIAVACK